MAEGFFDNSQFHSATDQKSSAVGNPDAKERKNNSVHCTISQIISCIDSEKGLVLFDQKMHFVECVGVAVSVEDTGETKNIYHMDDYTTGGPIEVQLWKNSNEGGSFNYLPPPIMEHNYMRVVGLARYDPMKPFIVAIRVDPILDPMCITNHFLHVVHDSLVLEKRLNATKAKARKGTIEGGIGNRPTTGDGFTPIQRMVLGIVRQHSQGAGIHRDQVATYASGTSKAQVNDALQFLLNEAHVFTTSNDDTFQVTDSF